MSRILLHGIPLSPSWIIWMMLLSASPTYVSNGSAITGSWISSGTGSKRKDKWYKNHLHSPPCHERKCLTFPLHLNSPPLYFSKLRGYHFGMNGTSCKSPGGGVATSVQCGSCLALNVPSKSFSESCIWETTFSGGFVASSMWALVGSLSSWWQSPHGSTGWKAIRSSWDQGSGRTCTQGPVKQSLGFWDFIHQARDWKGVGTGDRSALPCKTSSKF